MKEQMIDKKLKISIIIVLINFILFLSSKIYIYFIKTGIKNKEAALGAALNPFNLLIIFIMKISFFLIVITGIIIVILGFLNYRKKSKQKYSTDDFI